MDSTYESRPAGAASEVLAGELNSSNSTGESRYPFRITLSAAAETYLEHLSMDLVLGNCELWQLPPSLSQLWTFAYADGRNSMMRKLVNLEAENDRLYLRAYNTPAQIREIQQRRLDGHFVREAERFFAEVS